MVFNLKQQLSLQFFELLSAVRLVFFPTRHAIRPFRDLNHLLLPLTLLLSKNVVF